MADYKDIAGRIRTTASDGVSVEAQEILDISKNKKQSQINAETDTTLANHASAIQGLNSQNYGTYTATDQTTAETDVLPAEGSEDTIYRLGNWDGTQYDVTCYSEYSWNGSAYVHISTKPQIGEVFDISAYHASGGTLATYADLSAALDSNNGGGVPQSLQKGGMSVKFVRTYDNKYVQYRLMADSFTTDVTQWQGVDSKPFSYSKNLVESGGVADEIENILKLSPYEEDSLTISVPNNGWLYKETTDGIPSSSSSSHYTNPIQLDPTKRYKAKVFINNQYDAGVAYYSSNIISAKTFIAIDKKFISALSSGNSTIDDILSVPAGATHVVLFTRNANTLGFAEMVFERAAIKSALDNLDASVDDNKVINVNKVYDNGFVSVTRTLAEAIALIPSAERINGRAIIYNDPISSYTLAIFRGGTFTDANNWFTYSVSDFMAAIYNVNARLGLPGRQFTLATAIDEVPSMGRFMGKPVVYYDGTEYNVAIFNGFSISNWSTESNWIVIPFTNLQLINSIGNKVDKVAGKGLSSNDFTDELKDKLEEIDPSIIVSPEIIAGMVDDYIEENSDGFVTQEKGVVVTTNMKIKLDSTILSDGIATLGTGWSGNISDGFTHASGNTAELTFDISSLVSSGDKLLVTFNATGLSESTDVYVSCGDSPLIKSYNGGSAFAAGVKYSSGVLRITSASNYTGTITNLKCRKVNANGAEEYTYYSANNVTTKLQDFIFGYWNVILGAGDTASKLQDGTRNIAMGQKALDSLVVGNRNVAIGTFSMPFVTRAEDSVSIGSDTTYPSAGNVDGCVAIGKGTLTGKDLDNCVAIGRGAAGQWTNALDRSKITVVGVDAGVAAKDKDTLVGYQSGKNQNGSQNTGVGYRALAIGDKLSVDITGQNLTCIGANASVANNDTAKAANNSTAIGAGATITKSNQVVLGDSAVTELVFGTKKIVFNQDGTITWEAVS